MLPLTVPEMLYEEVLLPLSPPPPEAIIVINPKAITTVREI